MEENEPIGFYEREYYIFSNFSSFAIEWKGCIYMTSEHVYQSEKFQDEKLKEEIRNQRSADAAFRLAQEYRKDHIRSDWDEVKVNIMNDIIREKVRQHPYIRKKLLDSGERELIEDSPKDAFWGWGPNKDGKNMLGKLWIGIREELKEGKI